MQRKLVLYIAMSLDGFIATTNHNIDFLNLVETPNEDYGYADFLQTIDTVIWGRKTFDKVMSFGIGIPHKDKQVWVISHTKQGGVEHAQYANNVVELVSRLKQQQGKDIYCDGGAQIVTLLLTHGLIDRIIVSVIPHLLGSGIRLFNDTFVEQTIKLKKTVSFPSGLVQLWYDVATDAQ